MPTQITERVADAINLTDYIEMRLFDGTIPHIRNHRVSVWVVAHMVADNDSVSAAEIAEDLHLSEEAVMAALLYYALHAEEVEFAEAEARRKYVPAEFR